MSESLIGLKRSEKTRKIITVTTAAKAPRAGSGYSMSLRATSPALNGHPHCWKNGYWLQTPRVGLKVSAEQTS